MEWLAAQLNLHRISNVEHPTSKWRVVPAENYEPQPRRDVYRFFELFDLPNIPKIEVLLRSAAEGKVRLTPPVKPFRSEEHTSELQSLTNLVCRLLLEKKNFSPAASPSSRSAASASAGAARRP